MGDVGDVFNELRAYRKEKRSQNTSSSTGILRDRDVRFESRNGGAHLMVESVHGVIDFWPSTGLWNLRNKSKVLR